MFKFGAYYVGDLCYIFEDEDWHEICDFIIPNGDGEYTLKNGARIAIHSTAFGDGIYRDQCDRQYAVDSGTIGCVRVSDLTPEQLTRSNIITGSDRELGQLIYFPEPFDVNCTNGFFSFGNIVEIETGNDDEAAETAIHTRSKEQLKFFLECENDINNNSRSEGYDEERNQRLFDYAWRKGNSDYKEVSRIYAEIASIIG